MCGLSWVCDVLSLMGALLFAGLSGPFLLSSNLSKNLASTDWGWLRFRSFARMHLEIPLLD